MYAGLYYNYAFLGFHASDVDLSILDDGTVIVSDSVKKANLNCNNVCFHPL